MRIDNLHNGVLEKSFKCDFNWRSLTITTDEVLVRSCSLQVVELVESFDYHSKASFEKLTISSEFNITFLCETSFQSRDGDVPVLLHVECRMSLISIQFHSWTLSFRTNDKHNRKFIGTSVASNTRVMVKLNPIARHAMSERSQKFLEQLFAVRWTILLFSIYQNDTASLELCNWHILIERGLQGKLKSFPFKTSIDLSFVGVEAEELWM